jgi:hypothetical protein
MIARILSHVFALGLVLSLTVPAAGNKAAAIDPPGTTTIYLPNIVKMLGGADGWNTPFIVQNVGTASANLTFEFRRFSDGSLVKSRYVPNLAPGTSVFHSPNHDAELAAGGQYSVVIKSFGSPAVAVVNEHQNEANPQRQEALSYNGLTSGSTKVFLPYVAVLSGGWYCTVITQNLGSAIANVTAAFTSFDGSKTANLTRNILAGGSQFIDPRFESALVAGTEYSVALTSNQPIGVVVNCHNDDASNPQPRAFSYDGVLPTNERIAYAPYGAKNVSGRSSRVIVQNMGLAPVHPVLVTGGMGGPLQASVQGPAALAPGAVWAYDFASSPFPNGELSVAVVGGQFALLVDTRSPTTAMAYATGATENITRLYLPNITRTLGGADGWTTPIVVQSQGAYAATLRWYRFADGVLVHTQPLLFSGGTGMSIKIDPRGVAQLSDNTQYAVTVESSVGGVSAVVLELNDRGGDSAMAYEGLTPAPTANFGTSNCTPSTGPAGTSFRCRFYGFPPGAKPTWQTTIPGVASTPQLVDDEPIAADGSWAITLRASAVGQRTISVTAGGVSYTAAFTVTSPTFSVTMSAQNRNGSIAATTKPGAVCIAGATRPDGTFVSDASLNLIKTADAAGQVSWTYPAQPGGGTGVQFVDCNSGAESHSDENTYTLP